MTPPKNVFLVEDNKSDQFFFTKALKGIENAVLHDVAGNGKEALDKLGNSKVLPDIIFTDIHMPVMNGIEYLSAISKNPQIKHIPVVVMSSDTTAIAHVRQLGAKAFIKKTDDYESLRSQVEQVVNMDFVTDIDLANQTFDIALEKGLAPY